MRRGQRTFRPDNNLTGRPEGEDWRLLLVVSMYLRISITDNISDT